jgi:hypothetical protein
MRLHSVGIGVLSRRVEVWLRGPRAGQPSIITKRKRARGGRWRHMGVLQQQRPDPLQERQCRTHQGSISAQCPAAAAGFALASSGFRCDLGTRVARRLSAAGRSKFDPPVGDFARFVNSGVVGVCGLGATGQPPAVVCCGAWGPPTSRSRDRSKEGLSATGCMRLHSPWPSNHEPRVVVAAPMISSELGALRHLPCS